MLMTKHFLISMCVPWELNPQPLRCYRNALPLSHRIDGIDLFYWATEIEVDEGPFQTITSFSQG